MKHTIVYLIGLGFTVFANGALITKDSFEEGVNIVPSSTRLTDGMNFDQCAYRPTANKPRKNMPDIPLVYKHGWDLPAMGFLSSRPGVVNRAFEQQLNERPFDGVVFTARKASSSLSNVTLTASDVESELKAYDLATFTGPKHNLAILKTYHIDGGFNGKNDDKAIDNLSIFARSLSKRSTIHGIFLDPEFYPSNTYGKLDPWHYSKHTCKGYTGIRRNDGFPDIKDKITCDINAYNRGYKVMKAMIKEWPDINILTLFGIWTHDPRTFELVNGPWRDKSKGFAPHVEWHHKQGLLPHFLSGMYAATICTNATYIDGTELYGLRKLSDFQKTGQFITTDITDNNPFLPTNIRKAYRNEVGLGFGIYDDRDPVFKNHAKWPLPTMTPATWKSTTLNAAKVATHAVWLYTEKHDWWSKDPNRWPLTPVEQESEWLTKTIEAINIIKQ